MDRLRHLVQSTFDDKPRPLELDRVANEYSLVADPEAGAPAWQPGAAPHRPAKAFDPTRAAGWAVAAILFLFLLLSHSTVLPEIERVDPHRAIDSLGKAAFDAVRGSHAPAAYNPLVGGLQSKVTIVSAFYRVENGKKHSVSEYDVWLRNFLGAVEQPIVFYCAPDQVEFIQGLRGDKPITIIAEWETPFDMPPLVELGGRTWAENQYQIDPEQVYHVPDVYAIWTAKPWIVKHAKNLDLYHSEYFWWMDAGAFRESLDTVVHDLREMPHVLDKLYADAGLEDDTIVVAAPAVPFPPGTEYLKSIVRGSPFGPVGDMVQGGFYGGKKAAIDWWERETMRMTVLHVGLQHFAGKEQPVWTQTAALNWQKIYAQNVASATGPGCGWNEWFRFPYWADGRECEVPAWNGPEYARIEAEEARRNGTVVVGGGGLVRRVRKREAGQ